MSADAEMVMLSSKVIARFVKLVMRYRVVIVMKSRVLSSQRCDAMRSESIQLMQDEVAGDVLFFLVPCI
jgi:hypothetical protein